MAGYSKNPLWKKLGIKEGHTCYLFHSPENYFELLEETPRKTEWDDDLSSGAYDFQHVFVTELNVLKSNWEKWKKVLKKDGSMWISW
ncbi:MAG: DUF3052 domain-containing protein, partial [Marinoscillum sp.]